jgi:hypothetical protein
MPKFLAVCHYNKEEISWHLEKNVGYWPVQMNGNKFYNQSNPEKTGSSCEGMDFSWLSTKVSRTLSLIRSAKCLPQQTNLLVPSLVH